MKNNAYSRRKFISKCIGRSSFLVAGGALILSSCGSKESSPSDKKQTATNFCDDLSTVSQDELDKRTSFAYADKSPMPDRYCGNCALFVPKADNPDCGECMLFKGPVRAAGYCIQWAAKE